MKASEKGGVGQGREVGRVAPVDREAVWDHQPLGEVDQDMRDPFVTAAGEGPP